MGSILVVSDFPEELTTVREQLSDPLGQVIYFHGASSEAESLFMVKQPLLLCRSREAEEAHALCVDGMFDDYVVNRPLHDPRRIDLSVRQLIARGMKFRELLGLTQEVPETIGDPSPPEAAPETTPEIMIVDDDDVYRSILVRVVEKAGMRAVECECGDEALQKLRTHKPDLMLVDQEMPGLTGLELLHRVRAEAYSVAIPVIMLTGVGTREVVKGSLEIGIQGFIAKPSNAATILERIHQALAKSKADAV
jgi:CheY-like chemotaxis protein